MIKKGVVVLPTVLMLGGVIVVIALSGALLMYLLTSGTYGRRLSAHALAAARGGIQDGMIRVVRNSAFTASTPYEILIGPYKATVTVTTIVSGSPELLTKEIISQGSARSRHRRLRAVVEINTSNGAAKTMSVEEQAIP